MPEHVRKFAFNLWLEKGSCGVSNQRGKVADDIFREKSVFKNVYKNIRPKN
jgi:hypothetical protein